MILREDFIKKYLDILSLLLYEHLPKEDTLHDMYKKADKIIHEKIKRIKLCT
jgi:hypothetical protein